MPGVPELYAQKDLAINSSHFTVALKGETAKITTARVNSYRKSTTKPMEFPSMERMEDVCITMYIVTRQSLELDPTLPGGEKSVRYLYHCDCKGPFDAVD